MTFENYKNKKTSKQHIGGISQIHRTLSTVTLKVTDGFPNNILKQRQLQTTLTFQNML